MDLSVVFVSWRQCLSPSNTRFCDALYDRSVATLRVRLQFVCPSVTFVSMWLSLSTVPLTNPENTARMRAIAASLYRVHARVGRWRQKQCRALPVIGAARRWSCLTGKLWLLLVFCSGFRAYMWNRWWVISRENHENRKHREEKYKTRSFRGFTGIQITTFTHVMSNFFEI